MAALFKLQLGTLLIFEPVYLLLILRWLLLRLGVLKVGSGELDGLGENKVHIVG